MASQELAVALERRRRLTEHPQAVSYVTPTAAALVPPSAICPELAAIFAQRLRSFESHAGSTQPAADTLRAASPWPRMQIRKWAAAARKGIGCVAWDVKRVEQLRQQLSSLDGHKGPVNQLEATCLRAVDDSVHRQGQTCHEITNQIAASHRHHHQKWLCRKLDGELLATGDATISVTAKEVGMCVLDHAKKSFWHFDVVLLDTFGRRLFGADRIVGLDDARRGDTVLLTAIIVRREPPGAPLVGFEDIYEGPCGQWVRRPRRQQSSTTLK
eukprot:TRINITY_DN68438_c0_g1_i1.p1 TRINITY_DN68438_c0_g1~~TRINITY_DN68438_c0_g1_i1.p1  ORF type:complete len:271 (-),score=31.09 TRINITY_DN68438_c0_g1_i1:30-842(-)